MKKFKMTVKICSTTLKKNKGNVLQKYSLGPQKAKKWGGPHPLFPKRALNINGLFRFSKKGMAQRNFVANLKKVGKKLRKYIFKGYVFVHRLKKFLNTTKNVF